MLSTTSHLLYSIQAHGEAAYPNEGAGVLLGVANADGSKTLRGILPLENQWESEEQYHRYLITPQAMLQAEKAAAKQGFDVIGIFHSHPDHPAEPSGMDRDWALPWYSYIITTVAAGKATQSRSWLLKDDRSAFEEERLEIGD